MNKNDFIKLLEHPETVQPIQTREIKDIINKYPYFQSARTIYLKTLKDLQSFRYNNELKKTAAYTTDRTILFDFITSKKFKKEKKLTENKNLTEKFNKERNSEEKILKPKNTEKKLAEKKLEIGKPLEFQENERYSFSKWLQLTNKQDNKPKKEKSEQENIIDNFIAKNPKISKIDKTKPLEIKVRTEQEIPSLMTETLAKIYLEQKKYDSAIKAYEILSLKYPEKSGFFADRIKQIQILQKSK